MREEWRKIFKIEKRETWGNPGHTNLSNFSPVLLQENPKKNEEKAKKVEEKAKKIEVKDKK